MSGLIKRANLKKEKFKKFLNKVDQTNDTDSDGDVSEEDITTIEEEIIGSIIGKNYLVAKYIGKGTFSKVWILYNLNTKEFVAGKIYPKKHYDEYTNELIILRQYTSFDSDSIHNINLITNFTDTFNDEEISVLVIPLYGKSVFNLVDNCRQNSNNISLSCCTDIIKSLCKSLVKLHDLNVLHMDIKLDNILTKGSSIDENNNNIEVLKKLISDNNYDNFIENKTLKELNKLNLNDMKKNQKKKYKKNIKTKVHKSLKNDYLEKYGVVFNNNDNNNNDNNKEENEESIETKQNVVNFHELSYVLSDYSNSTLEKEVKSDRFYQIRPNRPPENILSITYTKRSDSWAIGTILWELLTGTEIFEPDLNKYKIKVERDRKQLSLIEKYLGKIPQNIIMDCPRSFELYDDKGELINIKKNERKDLREKLKKYRPDLSDVEIYNTCVFLIECWKYDYLKRLSPEELLQHSYLNPVNEDNIPELIEK
jgi:serine/threonine protein kinase